MHKDVREIRTHVEALGARGAGNRYPAELRRRAAAFAQESRRGGHTATEVAETLGIPWPTLKRWMEGETVVTGFTRVTVSEPQPSLTLVTPSGCRIEGLTVEQAAELVRRL